MTDFSIGNCRSEFQAEKFVEPINFTPQGIFTSCHVGSLDCRSDEFARYSEDVDELLRDHTNHVTVLFTQGQHAGKTFEKQPDGRIKVTAYDSGKWFTHSRFPVNNIHDLYDLVRLIEAEAPTRFIVQGEVLPEYREKEQITKTLATIPEKNQLAMMRYLPEGSYWIKFDFDKIDLPPGMTPQQGVEMLVKMLPVEFHDVSYCYQLSSSAGITGTGYEIRWDKDEGSWKEEEFTFPGWTKISAHVFFWFSRRQPHLHRWAQNLMQHFIATRGKKIIDPQVLVAVQPNYCTTPKFINMPDPIPAGQRSGFVQKTSDAVDLVWIDPPPRYIDIGGEHHRVGAKVQQDGKTYLATPSVQDRLDMIGVGGSFREPLMALLGYYFWLFGRSADGEAIKTMIRQAPIIWGGRNYAGSELDRMVAWYVARSQHEPMAWAGDAALLARLVEWRADAPKFPDEQDDLTAWLFDVEESGLTYYFIEGECGSRKTEWMIDQIAKPRHSVVALLRISAIREVHARLTAKHPTTERSHLVQTIYTDKENDIRDEEDEPDDAHAVNGNTVTRQIEQFRERVKKSRKPVVLFITHAALQLIDWWEWEAFDLYVDEVFEPYQTQTRDNRNSASYVQQHVEVKESETNYHRLGLTDAGYQKLEHGSFDDNEQALRSLLEAVKRPGMWVYAHKQGWDQMASQKLLLMRLLHAGFVSHFRSVTIIGDEFTRSTLAMAFANKYAVDWQPHPEWRLTQTRTVPLKDRVRLRYFASKDELRGSVTNYSERNLIPKLIAWLKAHEPAQTLITTNRRFKHYFAEPDLDGEDMAYVDGIWRRRKGKRLHLVWVPPKIAGTNTYRDMISAAYFAAMRPGKDEAAFVSKALLISEEEIIRWREYNPLYQFVMRICLRKFESDQVATIYVFDEYQAEYLRDRFGGCLEYTHIEGVIPVTKANKGGRPRMEGAVSAETERKRRLRAKKKQGV